MAVPHDKRDNDVHIRYGTSLRQEGLATNLHHCKEAYMNSVQAETKELLAADLLYQ